MQDHELLACFKRGLIPGPGESEGDFMRRVEQVPRLSPWEENVFGVALDWAPITYSAQGLAWWEGAATWVEEQTVSIQLRPAFQTGPFLGYRPSEILAHEAVHAARICFQEPQFEEMLAYQTAPQRWKRLLGPLFQRHWEPWVVLGSLVAGLYHPFIPIGVMGGGMCRLMCRHFQLRRCLRQFSLPAILCMTDEEIIKGRVNESNDLRVKLIRALSSERP